MVQDQLELPYSTELEARLERFERVRAVVGLSRMDVRYLKERVRILWPGLPPVVVLDDQPKPFVERSLRWLVKLEREWGEPLATQLGRDALRFDVHKRQFSVGRDLFEPAERATLAEQLAQRLGYANAPGRSFEEYALRGGLPGLELDEGRQVRLFLGLSRDALKEGRAADAVRDALQAWELRQGDPDSGTLVVRAASRLASLGDERVLKVAAQLEADPTLSADVLYALSQLRWKRGEHAHAGHLARRATRRDSAHHLAWRLVGAAAAQAGDMAAFLAAFRHAATLGDKKALAMLVRKGKSNDWGPIVADWPAEVDAMVLGLQLRWWVIEHRFRRAVRDALQQPVLLGDLEPSALQALEEAARQVPGGTMGVREALRSVVDSSPQAAVLKCYARLSLEDGQAGEVVRLARQHPGVLDLTMVVLAYADLEDWPEVLRRTRRRPELAALRLRALQRHSIDGAAPRRAEIGGCLSALASSGSLEPARLFLSQLEATLSDHPFTEVLREQLQLAEAPS